MSEEEKIKKMDKDLRFLEDNFINDNMISVTVDIQLVKDFRKILDLYNKQKQEAEHYKIENLIKHKCLFNIAEKVGITKDGITESMIINAIDNNYISKDKVLKAIGYEENDEEYYRLKQDDEKLLSILDTLYSEVCRLEDIEDKKVEVAIAFIEEKRDKYWQNKIRDKINELEYINKFEDEPSTYTANEYIIEKYKELLEEE